MTGVETALKFIGMCPQSNVQFDFLTLRENLWLFAKIKGIVPREVEQEVYEYARFHIGNDIVYLENSEKCIISMQLIF